MNLRDEIVAAIDAAPADNPMWMDAAADAILALVRTDIDALLAETRDWQSRWDAGRVKARTKVLKGGLIDALTTERAKVAELEAEVDRLKADNHRAISDGRVDMLTLTRSDLEIELAHLKAEAARWREAKAEPVAWAYVNPDGECEQIEWGPVFDDPHVTPLYALPPAPESK